jgi:CheY-like chemotaxis protein
VVRTILVVDDEELIVSLLQRALAQAGYNVIVATDPKQAIRFCEDQTLVIDAVLTDLMMPTMNGRELSDRITQLRGQLPVVYMSGYSDFDTDTFIQDSPSRTILTKPFRLPLLMTSLSALFEGTPVTVKASIASATIGS